LFMRIHATVRCTLMQSSAERHDFLGDYRRFRPRRQGPVVYSLGATRCSPQRPRCAPFGSDFGVSWHHSGPIFKRSSARFCPSVPVAIAHLGLGFGRCRGDRRNGVHDERLSHVRICSVNSARNGMASCRW
jgi:hypothetical protein